MNTELVAGQAAENRRKHSSRQQGRQHGPSRKQRAAVHPFAAGGARSVPAERESLQDTSGEWNWKVIFYFVCL